MRTLTLTCPQAFGDVLRQVRLYKHLTPEDLAANSGVPLSRILRFENGMTEPNLSELFLLGRALNAKAASIVEGVDLLMNGALHGVRRNGNGGEPPSPSQSLSSPEASPNEHQRL